MTEAVTGFPQGQWEQKAGGVSFLGEIRGGFLEKVVLRSPRMYLTEQLEDSLGILRRTNLPGGEV